MSKKSISKFMKDAPKSAQFNDYYFSPRDGWAETQHVFIEGNNLPHAWKDKESFTIFETGFGTGLNFFAAWDLFDKTATENQTLDFVSVEKYPLKPNKIKEYLKPWKDIIGDKVDILCAQYPIHVRGAHRLKINAQITLTLIFDDIDYALPQFGGVVDCWFLDGFAPAKNPEMWTFTLFENMARLSSNQARFASFTAAKVVRSGLEAVGFKVQKQKGYAYKSDMISGYFEGWGASQKKKFQRGASVAIIGGGLSGTACAYTLSQYGFTPTIYEAQDHLGAGASGNSCGFYNPRFTALWDGVSSFFAPAYAQFIKMAQQAGDEIENRPSGALHIINAIEKQKRFEKMLENWSWGDGHAQILKSEDVARQAGIEINHDALFLKDAGSVNTKKLCAYYARDIDVKINTTISDLSKLEEDIIIICNAYSADSFGLIDSEDIQKVRGQISVINTNNLIKNLKSNIHYGGYISSNHDETHHIGATFQPWEKSLDIKEEDHDRNIKKLIETFPELDNSSIDIKDGWAGYRTASKDRFPIVGHIEDNIFTSLAFGSHGLVGSLQAAHILADILRGQENCLQIETKKSLRYQRFIERKRKKQ